ncbi:hypothetical protein AQUCO_00600333v1 [Aquilegia coerulea]|uniref:MATH domain-containing protein n=1 Tax=Aquilegia coerulea TaxID=218851 RepID=A0A2G5EPA2_AQUCA|nr:hypothetical protein AQUCO_00600333v1 [Aquilegia coerulea]
MEGLFRSMRDAPPSHFRFRIESFSSLLNSSLKKFESCEFTAGDYKWKLVLYPNGNKERDGKDHLSLYLVLVDKNCLKLNKEILVTFSLFTFDHIRDKYLSVQQLSRFHAMKSESGFDKFLSHKIFCDPSHGFLMNNSCMFGAEVFVINSTTNGQCLSMLAVKPLPFKYTWTIQNFSRLEDKSYYSEKFRTADHDWKIKIYPKGNKTGKGKCLSLYLHMADAKALLPAGRVVVDYKLSVVDQVNAKHTEFTFTFCFSASEESWGRNRFLSLSKLNKSTGYLLNDTCILKAEVTVLGSARSWG